MASIVRGGAGRYPSHMRYGFLGPETTFTHQALLQALVEVPEQFAEDAELVPFTSVAVGTTALLEGEIDAIMAPIENSVDGGVSGTLDVLASHNRIMIVAEQIVPITFVLAAKHPMELADVHEVTTHTTAQAQVQGWMRDHLPDAALSSASSTAGAAAAIAEAADQDAAHRVAVCAPLAAEHFGLTVLADGIEDNTGAQTRFVLYTRNGTIPARTGADKTTVVVQLPYDRAGALLEMLQLFNANGVNLSRIESRPTGDALGRYQFSLDVEGHLEDRRVAASLRALRRMCPVVIYLGSYPRADRGKPRADQATSDAAYDDAHAWVDGLSRMISSQ
jgi:prephenate dehydratase